MNKIDDKINVFNKAKSLSLCSTQITCAEPSPQIIAEIPTQIAVVESLTHFDTSVPFKLDDETMAALYEECAAIKQFDAGMELKTAERRAIIELQMLKDKQPSLKQPKIDYWNTIFEQDYCLSEKMIIERMLDLECIPSNPKNNTLMLNILFQDMWDGYICNDDGPNAKTHKYVRANHYLEKAV